MIAYNDDDEVRKLANQIGFKDSIFFDRDGSQAYLLENETDCVITCRGTEPNEWNDIKADANAYSAAAETVGKVHSGFKQEVDDLWPMMEKELVENQKTLWFTGHSLGGAMATICASRCFLSHIKSTPEELHTYGSPRVGNKKYVTHAPLVHFRWVNNNDIVTRVPPAWFGYVHCGNEMYLDRHGKIRKISGWQRAGDRFFGFLRGLGRLQVDHFSDHSTHDYIKHIFSAILEEEGITEEEFEKQKSSL